MAANALVIVGVGSLIGRLSIGEVSERIGRMVTLSIAYLLLSIGILVVVSAPGLAALDFSSFLVGWGYGAFIATNLAAT